MPLEAPILDDRDFQDLFAEARALIPRYTPEWTNHNDSDPGISMLQLQAWLTDILLYRLNRVPERNYIKFLQLLGIELQPGRAATTELTFSLSATAPATVIVPARTQVAAAEPDEEGEAIIFEIDEALIAMKAELAAVQVFDAVGYSIQTNANSAVDQSYHPFGVYAREGSALMLGFRSDDVFPDQQINLAVFVHEAAESDSVACSLQLDALPLPAELVWEYWNGSEWKALSLDKDETQALSLSGHVYFTGPGSRAVKAAMGDVAESLYWIRCRLARSQYEIAPRLQTVRTNTVRSTQAQTIADEVLGGSSGRPDQSFLLANAPVVELAYPLQLTAADGAPITISYVQVEVAERPAAGVDPGFQVWREVSDFAASGPDDPHYTLNRTTGEIRFGNGTNGRIPVANPTNPNGNVVARLYRTGGGTRGNVGADSLTSLLNFVQHVEEVTNPFSALGGGDEETVAAAKLRAPAILKSRDRAVTAEDFEYFARETPGVLVSRALALPLVHPQFKGVPVPGAVTVVVVPDSDEPAPMPGTRTLRAVCDCLNQRRLLTTEVYVIPPVYRRVLVEVDVIAQRQADLATAKRGVEQALGDYFHPLRGGNDGQGWPFGETIFFSRIYQRILSVAGVDRIDNNQLVIFLDGDRQDFCRDVPLGEGELLYSDEHTVRVSY
jgi:predicted phage baseplate assembly protein